MVDLLQEHSIAVALRAFLLSIDPTGDVDRDAARAEIATLIGDRIHYQHAPEFTPNECEQGIDPYVWYRQSGTIKDRCLESYDPNPHIVTLDVEVWSVDPATGEQVEHDFAVLLEGFTGLLGLINVFDVLIENQDDDYVPQGISGDYGLHGQAFQIEFYPDWST